jgi:hypothetical protein
MPSTILISHPIVCSNRFGREMLLRGLLLGQICTNKIAMRMVGPNLYK